MEFLRERSQKRESQIEREVGEKIEKKREEVQNRGKANWRGKRSGEERSKKKTGSEKRKEGRRKRGRREKKRGAKKKGKGEKSQKEVGWE